MTVIKMKWGVCICTKAVSDERYGGCAHHGVNAVEDGDLVRGEVAQAVRGVKRVDGAGRSSDGFVI